MDAFAVGILFWIPMPGTLWASWIAVLGALMILLGMAFTLWGKLALGKTFGAEWTEYRSRVPMIFPRLFSPPRRGEG